MLDLRGDTPDREDASHDASVDQTHRDAPRRRGWRFWLIVVLVGAATLFALWRGALWWRIQQEIAAVRAAGHPASIVELNAILGPAPYLEDNAAPLLAEAYARLDRHRLSTVREHLAGDWDTPTRSAMSVTSLQLTVADHEEALQLVRDAADRPACRFLHVFPARVQPQIDPADALWQTRWLGLLLEVSMIDAAQRGDADGVVEAVGLSMRLGDMAASDPRPEAVMVGRDIKVAATRAAMRALPRVRFDDAALAWMQDAVADAFPAAAMRDAAIVDRALWIDLAWGGFDFFRNEFAAGETGELQWSAYTVSGLADFDRMTYLQYMDDVVGELSRPGSGVVDRLRRKDEAVASLRPVCGYTVQNIWSQLVEEHLRGVALLRAFRVAIAVERYRVAHGDEPDALSRLVPRFLPELPDDPFDSGPLRYARVETGYDVYSLGPDRKDDHAAGTLLGAPAPSANYGVSSLWEVDVTFKVRR